MFLSCCLPSVLAFSRFQKVLRIEPYCLNFSFGGCSWEERRRRKRKDGCGGAAATEWNLGMSLFFPQWCIRGCANQAKYEQVIATPWLHSKDSTISQPPEAPPQSSLRQGCAPANGWKRACRIFFPTRACPSYIAGHVQTGSHTPSQEDELYQ